MQLEFFSEADLRKTQPDRDTFGHFVADQYRAGLRADAYAPSHPWFYLLGGQPLPSEAIAAIPKTIEQATSATPKKSPTPARLLDEIRQIKASLARSIGDYRECVKRGVGGVKLMPWDDCPRLAWSTSVSLLHNHICYERTELRRLNRQFVELSRKTSGRIRAARA